MVKYDKLKISMKYWLLGRGYKCAYRAFEFGKSLHTGTRKDGKTPEFQHQLEMAHLVRQFWDDNRLLAACFLHDVREDFNIPMEELEVKFGISVARLVNLLSKKFRQDKTTKDEYYKALAESPRAAFLKGIDRIHNLSSMYGVFNKDKQFQYIEETQHYILPMLKNARITSFNGEEVKFEQLKVMINHLIMERE